MYNDKLLEALEEMCNEQVLSSFSNPLDKKSDEEMKSITKSMMMEELEEYVTATVEEFFNRPTE